MLLKKYFLLFLLSFSVLFANDIDPETFKLAKEEVDYFNKNNKNNNENQEFKILNLTLSDNGVFIYKIKIKKKSIENQLNISFDKDIDINDLKAKVIPIIFKSQLDNICHNKNTRNLLKKGFKFKYIYLLENKKFGSTFFNKRICRVN
jgi:hypothetical protein